MPTLIKRYKQVVTAPECQNQAATLCGIWKYFAYNSKGLAQFGLYDQKSWAQIPG